MEIRKLGTGQDMLCYRYDQNLYDEIECFCMRINDVTKRMGRSHRFSTKNPNVSRIAGYMLERIMAYWLLDNGIPFNAGEYMRTRQDKAQQDLTIYGKTVGCKCKMVEQTIDYTLHKYNSWLYPDKERERFHLLPTPDYIVFGLHEPEQMMLYVFGWIPKDAVRCGILKYYGGHAAREITQEAWHSMLDLPAELNKYRDCAA